MKSDIQPFSQRKSAGVDVSIVMPCLNERRTLPTCIGWAQEALSEMHKRWGLTGEIVIADNGSTDGSQELARSLGARVVLVRDRGYGAALRGGILAAHGTYIVMGDADASYDFRESVAMVEQLMAGADLCMGTRLRGTIYPGAMPWKNRYIGNPALTGILNLFFRTGMSDAHSGLRAFTKEAFLRMNPTSPGMEFASEIVVKAALLGLRRTEVPISLRPDGRDRPPHLRPWRDGWRHLRYLFMLSPLWLFFLPAALLGGIGLAMLGALLSVPAGEMFTWGPLRIGDHWAVLAGGLISVAHLAVFLGWASWLLAVREGYRRAPQGRWVRFLERNSMDAVLIGSGVFLAAGLVVLGVLAWAWWHAGEVSLHWFRYIVAGTTSCVLGVQQAFGAFFVAIANGNRGELATVVSFPSPAERPEAVRQVAAR